MSHTDLEHNTAEVSLVPVQGLGQVEHLVSVQAEDGVTRGEAQLQADVATNLELHFCF